MNVKTAPDASTRCVFSPLLPTHVTAYAFTQIPKIKLTLFSIGISDAAGDLIRLNRSFKCLLFVPLLANLWRIIKSTRVRSNTLSTVAVHDTHANRPSRIRVGRAESHQRMREHKTHTNNKHSRHVPSIVVVPLPNTWRSTSGDVAAAAAAETART